MRSASMSMHCLHVLVVVLGLATSVADAAPLADGDILVADENTGEIRHFSATGADRGSFASGFLLPAWIAGDKAGNLYISEYGAGRIHKLSPEGVNLLTIVTPFTPGGLRVADDGTIYVAAYGNGPDSGIYRYDGSGGALGLFSRPSGMSGDFIEFDTGGNLYAPNFGSGAVIRMSPGGDDLGTFVTFPGAEGIAFDSSGNLYVSSYSTNVIRRYSAAGADLGEFASLGPGASTYGMAFDSDGNLYVAYFVDLVGEDLDDGLVRKFSPSGVDLGVFARGMELPRDVLVVRKPPRVFELPAVADSFMRQGAPNTNEGANPRLRIQEAGNNRALVAFELVGIPLNRITRATLVLTIAENADNWGRNNDRTVDAHRLLTSFIEGNGQAAGLSNSETARGSGSGVTWHCAADANVANQIPDCSARWNGGSFSPATAAAYTHVNGLRGDVTWDVTADVQAGATRWLIKKTNEALSGQVSYYSREGAGEAGNPELAPRLIVEVD